MSYTPSYTYAQLSALSAGRLVAANYDMPGPLQSRFHVLGLHDNYLIESRAGAYILRIYRNHWRSPTDVHFELALLEHLHERSAPVAWPIPTKTGELCFEIDSPEGRRLATLFHYAKGHAPANNISADQCLSVGRAVAQIHELANDFATPHTRPELDLAYLVDDSVEAIRPFLTADARAYLDGLQERLRLNWPDLPRVSGPFGACIGDVNATNFHVADDGSITLFDFDQCGFGFRAFEIAKFAASLQANEQKQALAKAFVVGYQEGRPLCQAEIDALPYFELVATLWVLAIHANNADRIGYKHLEQPFWDRNLAVLGRLEDQPP